MVTHFGFVNIANEKNTLNRNRLYCRLPCARRALALRLPCAPLIPTLINKTDFSTTRVFLLSLCARLAFAVRSPRARLAVTVRYTLQLIIATQTKQCSVLSCALGCTPHGSNLSYFILLHSFFSGMLRVHELAWSFWRARLWQ